MRTSYIKWTLSSSIVSSFPYLLSCAYNQKLTLDRTYASEPFSANDQINLALIGCGIDFDSYAMAYAKAGKKPAVGVGVILGGHTPINCMMDL